MGLIFSRLESIQMFINRGTRWLNGVQRRAAPGGMSTREKVSGRSQGDLHGETRQSRRRSDCGSEGEEGCVGTRAAVMLGFQKNSRRTAKN